MEADGQAKILGVKMKLLVFRGERTIIRFVESDGDNFSCPLGCGCGDIIELEDHQRPSGVPFDEDFILLREVKHG
jgi:hypothetical protein